MGTSLMVQWLRICLPVQGTWVRSLVQKDPTCCRAPTPAHRLHWGCTPETLALQWEKPLNEKLHSTTAQPTHRNWKRPVCKKTQRSGNEDRQKVFWKEKYRTISLMNVNAKVFTKILASQIEQCIKWIRYYNQVGFISGMRGFFNIQKSR